MIQLYIPPPIFHTQKSYNFKELQQLIGLNQYIKIPTGKLMNIQEEKIVGNIVTCNPYVTYLRYSEIFGNKMKWVDDFEINERGMA